MISNLSEPLKRMQVQERSGKSRQPHTVVAYLIGFLVGTHFLLLGAGAFCSSSTFQTNSQHHSHQIPVTSILCSWACHTCQIAALTTSTSQNDPSRISYGHPGPTTLISGFIKPSSLTVRTQRPSLAYFPSRHIIVSRPVDFP